MNKISIISDTRLPTENVGNHGLGRVAWDVANGFHKLGYDVTLYCGKGSIPPFGVDMIQRKSEMDFSLIVPTNVPAIDFSHFHSLSLEFPEAPVLNYISDGEVNYNPPNPIVCVAGDLIKHPNSELVPLGIDLDQFKLYTAKKLENLLFMAKIIPEKGVDLALKLRELVPNKILFAGKKYYRPDLRNDYLGELRGEEAYVALGSALGLLQFTRFGDGGGRIALEAAACGTATLCLNDNAAQEHVWNGVSGFVCKNLYEVADMVQYLQYLKPKVMREWVENDHNINWMVYRLNRLVRNL